VSRNPSKPGIDHRRNSRNSNGGLGNVGRENHLLPFYRLEGTLLLRGKEISVQRENDKSEPLGDWLQCPYRTADFSGPGQKHQDVPSAA
jgi:hypothetical protein